MIGKRVVVRDGSGEKTIGRGVITDQVTVYARMDGDGVLKSLRIAEEMFDGARPIPNNPKILLDDGRTVYGCQVWWEAEEGPLLTKEKLIALKDELKRLYAVIYEAQQAGAKDARVEISAERVESLECALELMMIGIGSYD